MAAERRVGTELAWAVLFPGSVVIMVLVRENRLWLCSPHWPWTWDPSASGFWNYKHIQLPSPLIFLSTGNIPASFGISLCWERPQCLISLVNRGCRYRCWSLCGVWGDFFQKPVSQSLFLHFTHTLSTQDATFRPPGQALTHSQIDMWCLLPLRYTLSGADLPPEVPRLMVRPSSRFFPVHHVHTDWVDQ